MALGAAYLILVAVGQVTWPGACLTEDLTAIPNLSGMKVEATYTNCDTFAKEEVVSVYISRAVAPGEPFLARWRSQRTLIFRYDPGRPDNPPPSITANGRGRILISIPEVSSVLLETKKWQDISVDYNIGHIDYR